MNILVHRDVEYDLDENRNYEIEEWRPINIGNIKPYYYVSNMGRIKNTKTDRILRPWMSNVGYLVISLPQKNNVYRHLTIHRTVLSAFTEEYEKVNDYKYIVNHKDGIKHHSYLSNLEWVTYSENYNHAIDNNLMDNTGENTYNAIHTEVEVRKICELLDKDNSISYQKICESIGLAFTPNNQKFISEVATRKKWKRISNKYSFPTRTLRDRHKYSDNEVKYICELFMEGYTIRDVLHKLNTPVPEKDRVRTFLHSIYNKTAYKSISENYIW